MSYLDFDLNSRFSIHISYFRAITFYVSAAYVLLTTSTEASLTYQVSQNCEVDLYYALSLAALAVLLDFFLQVTAFVALIVFDIRRAEDSRVDCFPCIRVRNVHAQNEEGIFSGSSCR